MQLHDYGILFACKSCYFSQSDSVLQDDIQRNMFQTIPSDKEGAVAGYNFEESEVSIVGSAVGERNKVNQPPIISFPFFPTACCIRQFSDPYKGQNFLAVKLVRGSVTSA